MSSNKKLKIDWCLLMDEDSDIVFEQIFERTDDLVIGDLIEGMIKDIEVKSFFSLSSDIECQTHQNLRSNVTNEISVKVSLLNNKVPFNPNAHNSHPVVNIRSVKTSNSIELDSHPCGVRRQLFGDSNSKHMCRKPMQFTDNNRETDQTKLDKRQKDIDKGKSDIDYQKYLEMVPKNHRREGEPITPDKHKKWKCRDWNTRIRNWKISFHRYVETEHSVQKNTDI